MTATVVKMPHTVQLQTGIIMVVVERSGIYYVRNTQYVNFHNAIQNAVNGMKYHSELLL